MPLPPAVAAALSLALPVPPGIAHAEDWQFEITPYIWGATISGDLATGGDTPVSAPDVGDGSFFALENLQAAYFLAFEAGRDRWRVLVDTLHLDYADDVRDGRLLEISAELEGYMFEGAAAYRLESHPDWELLGGARYFSIRTSLDSNPGPESSVRKDWADPFLGVRYTHRFSDHWRVRARADVGGFGVNADSMANLAIEADYSLTDSLKLRAGYRYLTADFERDGFIFDVAFTGPAVGLSFQF
ncbi:MAG: hypothetical protein H6953_14115 [Chromatiaceae bacterium]|nr:hypothetical protein [Chromatiaceae bacterium]MCP5312127.1 hypothetical protein [Chromatiaceae bacterium]